MSLFYLWVSAATLWKINTMKAQHIEHKKIKTRKQKNQIIMALVISRSRV